jgi:hypothetical protein
MFWIIHFHYVVDKNNDWLMSKAKSYQVQAPSKGKKVIELKKYHIIILGFKQNLKQCENSASQSSPASSYT